MDDRQWIIRIFNNRNKVTATSSRASIIFMICLFAATITSPLSAAKMVQAEVKTNDDQPLKWDKPKPGHIIDGAAQMVIAGTDIKLYLTGGSAQIDLREGQGRCFIPAGARFKEKQGTGGFGQTIEVPESNGGTWYDNSVRRLIFLAGHSVGSEDYPLTLQGDGWLVVRGYNAVVVYKINEKDEETKYRFPIRDTEAEAKEAASQKRLRSRDAMVRAKERYVRSGALRSSNYYHGGVFNGF
jgi:hypothetical protein